MLETINIIQVRNILEAAGVKTRIIRRDVTSAIYDGKIKQKTRFSTALVPGTLTLEEFLTSILTANKRSWNDVESDKLSDAEQEIVSEIL